MRGRRIEKIASSTIAPVSAHTSQETTVRREELRVWGMAGLHDYLGQRY
jgi:hypothetical protein